MKSSEVEDQFVSMQHNEAITVQELPVEAKWDANPELKKFESLLRGHCYKMRLDPPCVTTAELGDGRFECRVWVGRQGGERCTEKSLLDSKGRACKNWLERYGGHKWRDPSTCSKICRKKTPAVEKSRYGGCQNVPFLCFCTNIVLLNFSPF